MRAAVAAVTVLTCALGAHAASTAIEQSGQVFSIKLLALARGGTAVFTNHDDVTHNVKVIDADGEPADLGLQKPGEILSHTFDKAGRFLVRCSIHPSMKMTINVQ